jgi:tetratricopeptide (TPR) repeat protein
MSIERDGLRAHCAEAADIDLVRILTVDKAHSVTALVDEASRELERRQLTVEGFLDRVEVRVGAEDAAVVTIAQARSLISDAVPLHAVAAVSHALEETMVIQHEGWGWVFHHYDEEEYGESYLVDSDAKAHELLGHFLLLTPWQPLAGPAQHLDDWETVTRTEEAQVVVEAAQKLTTAGVVHIVRSPLFTPEGDHHITLLVPQTQLTSAEEALGISRQSLRQLKREATQLGAGDDREAELAVYEQLARMDPTQAAVHYNHGVVLLELDRPEQALASFLEAAAPTLGNLPERPEPPRGRVGPGGLFAMFGLVARILWGPPKASGPEYLVDVEMQLQRLQERLGDRVDLLHGLAGLARWRADGETVRDCYERILRLNDQDEIAHFQLRYLAATDD